MNDFMTSTSVINLSTPIHNDLTAFFLLFVEEVKKYAGYDALNQREGEIAQEKEILRDEAISVIKEGIKREKANLSRIGFISAKTERLKRYEEKLSVAEHRLSALNDEHRNIEYQKATKEILQHLKKDFGEETLFVSYDDFEKVLNKYNLICGRLSDYKGVLPEHKMSDIRRVLSMEIPEFWKDKISELVSAYDVIISPFRNGFRKYDPLEFDYRFSLLVSGSYPEGYTAHIGNFVKFFIAAPAHEMKTKEEIQEEAERRARDPFICAHTKWGIIIFTKWGEEAEDKIIKKYEK